MPNSIQEYPDRPRQ